MQLDAWIAELKADKYGRFVILEKEQVLEWLRKLQGDE